jgi:hypothetical protein
MKLTLISLLLFQGLALANYNGTETRQERIRRIFNDLRATNTEILDDFYHPQIEFVDSIGKVNGLPAMKSYYKMMYKNVEEIKFDFIDETIQGDLHLFVWQMHLKASKLNSGKTFTVEGVSKIKFDPQTNLVIYHRDYFDMGDFIYERLPVVGPVIRMLKKQFQHD